MRDDFIVAEVSDDITNLPPVDVLSLDHSDIPDLNKDKHNAFIRV